MAEVDELRLLNEIGRLRVPYVWVRGNHDSPRIQAAVAAQPNSIVLDGEGRDVAGLRVWGFGDPRYTADKSQPVGKGQPTLANALSLRHLIDVVFWRFVDICRHDHHWSVT